MLEAWIASDAKESATEHQPVVQAIRAWLRKESLQAMSPKKPIADGGEDGQSNGAVLMDVEEGAGAATHSRGAVGAGAAAEQKAFELLGSVDEWSAGGDTAATGFPHNGAKR